MATAILRHVGSYSLVDGYASVKPFKQLTVLFGIKNIANTSSAVHQCIAEQLCVGVQRAHRGSVVAQLLH
jgi:hypothetical protein